MGGLNKEAYIILDTEADSLEREREREITKCIHRRKQRDMSALRAKIYFYSESSSLSESF